MTGSSITRLPRVRRFEYLIIYLESVQLGLDSEALSLRLAERKKGFEIQKLKALGRGKTFSKNRIGRK